MPENTDAKFFAKKCVCNDKVKNFCFGWTGGGTQHPWLPVNYTLMKAWKNDSDDDGKCQMSARSLAVHYSKAEVSVESH